MVNVLIETKEIVEPHQKITPVFDISDLRHYEEVDKIWFCLVDIGRMLELDDSSVRQMKTRGWFDEDEMTTVTNCHTHFTYVSESALYRIINRSNSPKARPFERWVTKEVLPSIRKTGSYSITKSPMERILENSKNQYEAALAIADMLKIEQDKQRLIEARADKAEDKFNTLVHNDNNTYTATDLAKDLGFRSAIAFNQWLKDIGFQYKQGKHWVVKAKYAEEGLVNIKLKDTGNGFNVKTMQFTNKGKLWITDKYRETHPKVLEIKYM